MMKVHEFTIIASGFSLEAEDFESRFFGAGCDDATLAFQKGAIIVEFSREAVSFSKAVESACENVLAAGAAIERIEPDHLVSLTEIAERCGLSKQAISLYTDGKRGEDFPNPVARVTSRHPLWDWSQVAEWLHRHDRIDREEVVRARIVKEANLHFDQHEAPSDNFRKRLEALEG
jgi:predicted DNA-binding transcriptional regulator AlpA